jgi:hypothetical protein
VTCQNYTDALNAVNAALLKALIFAGSSIKGWLFQVTMVLGKNENLKISLLQETCWKVENHVGSDKHKLLYVWAMYCTVNQVFDRPNWNCYNCPDWKVGHFSGRSPEGGCFVNAPMR